jgi:hypothetical protein
MDAELNQVFKEQAAKNSGLVALIRHEAWPDLVAFIDSKIQTYDSVKGVSSDSEWIRRQAKVEALEDLKSVLDDIKNEVLYAKTEIETETESG